MFGETKPGTEETVKTELLTGVTSTVIGGELEEKERLKSKAEEEEKVKETPGSGEGVVGDAKKPGVTSEIVKDEKAKPAVNMTFADAMEASFDSGLKQTQEIIDLTEHMADRLSGKKIFRRIGPELENFVTGLKGDDFYILFTGIDKGYSNIVTEITNYLKNDVQRNVVKIFVSNEEVIIDEPDEKIHKYSSTFEVVVKKESNVEDYEKINLIIHGGPSSKFDINTVLLLNTFKNVDVLCCTKRDIDEMLRRRAQEKTVETRLKGIIEEIRKDTAISKYLEDLGILEGGDILTKESLLAALNEAKKDKDLEKSASKFLTMLETGDVSLNKKQAENKDSEKKKKYEGFLQEIKSETLEEDVDKLLENLDKYKVIYTDLKIDIDSCINQETNEEKINFIRNKLLPNNVEYIKQKISEIINQIQKPIQEGGTVEGKDKHQDKEGTGEKGEEGKEEGKGQEEVTGEEEDKDQGQVAEQGKEVFDDTTKLLEVENNIRKYLKGVLKGLLETEIASIESSLSFNMKDVLYAEKKAYRFTMDIAKTENIMTLGNVTNIIHAYAVHLPRYTKVLTGIALCFNDVFMSMKDYIDKVNVFNTFSEIETDKERIALKSKAEKEVNAAKKTYLEQFKNFRISAQNIDKIFNSPLQGGGPIFGSNETNKHIKAMIDNGIFIGNPNVALLTDPFFKDMLDFMHKFVYIMQFVGDIDQDLDEMATPVSSKKKGNTSTKDESFRISSTNSRARRAVIFQMMKDLYKDVDINLVPAFKILEDNKIESIKGSLNLDQMIENYSKMATLKSDLQKGDDSKGLLIYKELINKYIKLYDIAHDDELVKYLKSKAGNVKPVNLESSGIIDIHHENGIDTKFHNVYFPEYVLKNDDKNRDKDEVINTFLKAVKSEAKQINSSDLEKVILYAKTIIRENEKIPKHIAYIHYLVLYIFEQIKLHNSLSVSGGSGDENAISIVAAIGEEALTEKPKEGTKLEAQQEETELKVITEEPQKKIQQEGTKEKNAIAATGEEQQGTMEDKQKGTKEKMIPSDIITVFKNKKLDYLRNVYETEKFEATHKATNNESSRTFSNNIETSGDYQEMGKVVAGPVAFLGFFFGFSGFSGGTLPYNINLEYLTENILEEIYNIIIHNLFIYNGLFKKVTKEYGTYSLSSLIGFVKQFKVFIEPWEYIIPSHFFADWQRNDDDVISLRGKIIELWNNYYMEPSYSIFASKVIDHLKVKVEEKISKEIVWDLRKNPLISLIICLQDYIRVNEKKGETSALFKTADKKDVDLFIKNITDVGQSILGKVKEFLKGVLGTVIDLSKYPEKSSLETVLDNIYTTYTSSILNTSDLSENTRRKMKKDFHFYYMFMDNTTMKVKSSEVDMDLLILNHLKPLTEKIVNSPVINSLQTLYDVYKKQKGKNQNMEFLNKIINDSSEYEKLFEGKKSLLKKVIEEFKKDPAVSEYFEIYRKVCPKIKVEGFIRNACKMELKVEQAIRDKNAEISEETKDLEETAKDTEKMYDDDEKNEDYENIEGGGILDKVQKFLYKEVPKTKSILFDQNISAWKRMDDVISEIKKLPKTPGQPGLFEKPVNINHETIGNIYNNMLAKVPGYSKKILGTDGTIHQFFSDENNANTILKNAVSMARGIGYPIDRNGLPMPVTFVQRSEIDNTQAKKEQESLKEAQEIEAAAKQKFAERIKGQAYDSALRAAENKIKEQDAIKSFGEPGKGTSVNKYGQESTQGGPGQGSYSQGGPGQGTCSGPQDKVLSFAQKLSEDSKNKMEKRLKDHLDFIEDFINFMSDKSEKWQGDIKSVVDREFAPLVARVKTFMTETDPVIRKKVQSDVKIFYTKFIKLLRTKAVNYYLFVKNFYIKDARKKVRELNDYVKKYDNVSEESKALIPKGYGAIVKRFDDLTDKFEKINTAYFGELAKLVDQYAGAGNFLVLEDDIRVKLSSEVDDVSFKIGKYRQKIKSYYRLNYSMADILLDTQFIVLYVIKFVRILFTYIALFLSTKVFTPIYEDTVYDKKENPPPLTKFLMIYFAFDIALNVFILTVLFLLKFLFKTEDNAFAVDKYLFGKYFMDYSLSMFFLLLIGYFLAGVVQSKKYFKYKYEGLRAVRAYQDMMFSAAVPIFLFPYFFMF